MAVAQLCLVRPHERTSEIEMSKRIGFVVIYRWRLHPGKEAQFRRAWERATPLLMRLHGALGSRLHQAEDGTWIAYAQWPSKAAWEKSRASDSVDIEARRVMLDAEMEAYPPILLTPVADFLQPGTIENAV
jgi:heme-degrading monooxygenase HmoA